MIRVISDLKVNFDYLSDLDKMFILSNLGMANTIVTIMFQISDATLIIRLSITVLNAFDFCLSS